MKHFYNFKKLLFIIFYGLITLFSRAQSVPSKQEVNSQRKASSTQKSNNLLKKLIKSADLNNFSVAGIPSASNPTLVSASPTSICVGSNVSLTATCAAGTVTWYNQASGGTSIGTGSPLTKSPTVTTTYYASCFVSGAPTRIAIGGSESSRVSAGTVTVTSIPSNPTSVSVNKTSVCTGEAVSLTATCSSGTVTWYIETSAIGTGTGLTHVPTDEQTRYFAKCINGSCESNFVAVDGVTVNPLPDFPTDVSVNDTNICVGTAVTLSANCSAGTLTWYTQATGGSAIGIDTDLSQSPTENTIYYAACVGEFCESVRVATTEVNVTAMPGIPTDVLVNKTSIFTGTTVYLTATCSSGTVTWYNQATEGDAIGTGSGLSIAPSTTTTYYASCKNGSCESSREATSEITVATLTDPTDVSVNKTSIVSGTKVLLSATCSGGQPVWYNQESGGNEIGVGTSVGYYPSQNMTFFAACRNGIYETSRAGTYEVSVINMPQLPYIVKDINPGSESSYPDLFVNLNGTLFFMASSPEYGQELWKSDGTPEGTAMVKDIVEGTEGSGISRLKKVGNKVFFVTTNTPNTQLWVSNGEESGTFMLKEIIVNNFIIDVNGTAFFDGTDDHGTELWKSDGTVEGTIQVKDIVDGGSGSYPSNPVNVNGTLFFSATDEANGTELWKSDGTTEGTVLVKDIRSGSNSSLPAQLTNINGQLYFIADDGVNGTELWTSNGTAEGTKMPKEIRSGNSLPNITAITEMGGVAYMIANDGVHGSELWRSDGTEDGTKLVKDIRVGLSASSISNLVNLNGILYFGANDGVNGKELWKSDGTEAGTNLLKDINPGFDGSFGSYPIVNVGGILYFSASDGTSGATIWKSDGSADGTMIVKDINSGPLAFYSEGLTDVNGKLFYYSAPTDARFDLGYELWSLGTCTDANKIVTTVGKTEYFNRQAQLTSDTLTCHCDVFNQLISKIDAVGTNPVSGTINVREWIDEDISSNYVRRHYEINPAASPSTSTGKVTLYFTQAEFNDYNNAINPEAPKLPADSSDTEGIANIGIIKYPGKTNDDTGLPDSYTNGYSLINPEDADIIWNSESARWEVSFNTTGFGGFFVRGLSLSEPTDVKVSSTTICKGQSVTMTASCAVGTVVWYTQLVDGTSIGTGFPLIQTPENNFSGYYAACEKDGLSSFRASTETITVMDVTSPTNVSVDKTSIVAGAKVTLNATCSAGQVVWYNQATGGNAIGAGTSIAYYPTKNTTFYAACQSGLCETSIVNTNEVTVTAMSQLPYLVSDLVPGVASSDPLNLKNLSGTIFFLAQTPDYGVELWKSDGTPEGTVLVKDINPGSESSEIKSMTVVGNRLFFTATDGTHGQELWVTNGEADGTYMVKDIIVGSGPGVASVENITDVNGTAFFTTNNGTNGIELWKSDGSPEGTMMVKDIATGFNSSNPDNLTNVNGVLFFLANDFVNDIQLWKSDGTPDRTIAIKDVNGNSILEAGSLTNINGVLYFTNNDGTNGSELWRSDGTSLGTYMVQDITPGSGGTQINKITEMNGIIYMAINNDSGEELWRTDGTAAGTYLVKTIHEGSNENSIGQLLSVNSVLYFAANDGIHGKELWKSNGTAEGTVLVKDIREGATQGILSELTHSDGTIYFRANDGVNGNAIWKSDGSAEGTVMVKDISSGITYSALFNITDVNGKLYFKARPVSDSYMTGIEIWSLGTCTDANKIVITNGKTNYFNSQAQPTSDTLTCHCDIYNKLLATIKATGNNPLGNDGLDVREWIDETATEAYVRRHYELSNTEDPVSQAVGTGLITLYFTQADFDAYNNAISGDAPKLPTNGEDATGKVHLNIARYAASSGDDTGTPESYSLEPVVINPENSAIVWNSTLERWEITFATKGLGGYFVKGLDLQDPTEVTVNKTAVCEGSSVSLTATCAAGTITWYNQASGGSAIGTGSPLVVAVEATTTYYAACEEDGTSSNRIATDEVTANAVPNEPVGVGVSNPAIIHGQSVTLYAICASGNVTWYNQPSGGAAIGTGYAFVYYPGATVTYYASCKTSDCESSRAGTQEIVVTAMDLVPYMVKNINTTADGSSAPGKFVTINGTMYFVAADSLSGKELWKTDGTKEGTTLVKDITPGGDSDIDNMTNVNGTLYFSIKTENFYELWKSDGSADGTVKVKDVWAVGDGQKIASFRALNSTLYFITLNTDNNVAELWKSNGNSAGTVNVMNINENGVSLNGNEAIVMNNTLFFQANTTDYGTELWMTDGTSLEMVKDIREGSRGAVPKALTNVNGILYFAADDGVNGMELWKSDGTADGTVIVKNIRSGSSSSDPDKLTNINSILYFAANDGTNGIELWKSDGTADGTVLVKDIASGGTNSYPERMMSVNGIIYFVATTSANGMELWKTDGTSDGTMLVKNIKSGSSSSFPNYLTNLNGKLYFTADNGVNGTELWTSDGTEAGTVMVKDIYAGSTGGNPNDLIIMNGKLYYSARTTNDNVNYGYELWSLGSCTSNNQLVDMPNKTPYYNSQTQPGVEALTCHCSVYNGLISAVEATGANQVSGVIDAKEWVEETAPVAYVRRHYEINPATNATTATGKVTLYFTQTDFDAYYAANNSRIFNIPLDHCDIDGIRNIRIIKRTGSSSDGSGLPGTYSGPMTIIDPEDEDIFWSNDKQSWVVSFATTGFGGYFLKAQEVETPTSASVNQTAICSGSTIELTATCTLGTVVWYNQASGGSPIGTSLSGTSSTLSQSPTVTTTYYAACKSGTYSSADRKATDAVVVTTQPTNPTSVSVSNAAICSGTAVSLTATCATGTIVWYNQATGGTAIGTGNSLSQSPSSSVTYYASCINGNCESSRVATNQVVVTSMPINPTGVSVSNTTVCDGTSVSLMATCSVGTVTWYNQATGGTALGTGSPFSQSPTVNTTYYAGCINGVCVSSRVATDGITIKSKPAKPAISGGNEICAGETVVLTASSTDLNLSGTPVYRWMSGASGNVMSVSPATTTNYKVVAYFDGCNSDSSEVFIVNVFAKPDAPEITADNSTICNGEVVLLTAQCPSLVDAFYWVVTQARPDAPINPMYKSIRSITSPGTYKGYCLSNNGCKSAETSITITQDNDCGGQNFIKVSPEKPVICPGSSVQLSATGCSGTVTWSDGSGTLIRTGTSVTFTPVSTTTYLVQCSTGGSTTNTVTIAPTSTVVSRNISTGDSRVKAVNSIESDKKVGDPNFTPSPSVTYEAGKSIVLKPGFVAEKGAIFKAEIKTCN
jgi:ELWxxDGT repeat protein